MDHVPPDRRGPRETGAALAVLGDSDRITASAFLKSFPAPEHTFQTPDQSIIQAVTKDHGIHRAQARDSTWFGLSAFCGLPVCLAEALTVPAC